MSAKIIRPVDFAVTEDALERSREIHEHYGAFQEGPHPDFEDDDGPDTTPATRLTLSWPAPGLSPNARLHWSRKSRLVKSARQAAWGATLEKFGAPARLPKGSRVHLEMVFCPPDKRRRDADNCIASMKASLDGISDALGVDDSRFVSTFRMGEPVKGGAVIVTVRSA